MILIEFPINLNTDNICIKYRNVTDTEWFYMYVDMPTLILLIQKFGIYSTIRAPTGYTNLDNETTGTLVKFKWHEAKFEIKCDAPKKDINNVLRYLEHPY